MGTLSLAGGMTLVSQAGENKNLLPVAAVGVAGGSVAVSSGKAMTTTLNPIQENSIHDQNIISSPAAVVATTDTAAPPSEPLNPSTTNDTSPPIIVPILPVEHVKTVARSDADKNVVVTAKVWAEKRNILSTAFSLGRAKNYFYFVLDCGMLSYYNDSLEYSPYGKDLKE